MVRGEVHDENAWALGGVAGHAGLFSTARDLAVLLPHAARGGAYGPARILGPDFVELLLDPARPGLRPRPALVHGRTGGPGRGRPHRLHRHRPWSSTARPTRSSSSSPTPSTPAAATAAAAPAGRAGGATRAGAAAASARHLTRQGTAGGARPPRILVRPCTDGTLRAALAGPARRPAAQAGRAGRGAADRQLPGPTPTDAPVLRDRADVAAYAAYRMPATFEAVRSALDAFAAAVPGLVPGQPCGRRRRHRRRDLGHHRHLGRAAAQHRAGLGASPPSPSAGSSPPPTRPCATPNGGAPGSATALDPRRALTWSPSPTS